MAQAAELVPHVGVSSIERLLPAVGGLLPPLLAARVASLPRGLARSAAAGPSATFMLAEQRVLCTAHRAGMSKPCHSLHAVLFVEAHVS